ncbi:hypothetical protein TREVI0001_0334 [Treponema vincentii ATCC 35580]|uniref:Uncharacterized protein n=1 Tax=Treponema vincentii ATCC 35580 TaxID=596324 RepID=C8PQ29_9SPIR|nr:hypothetical protein TREVI0001_0334 [Treponema vincentii ATCC 35580]
MNREEVQLWSNSLNFSAGLLKKRPDAFTLIACCSPLEKIFFFCYV